MGTDNMILLADRSEHGICRVRYGLKIDRSSLFQNLVFALGKKFGENVITEYLADRDIEYVVDDRAHKLVKNFAQSLVDAQDGEEYLVFPTSEMLDGITFDVIWASG